MKLLYSPASPYARCCLVHAHEVGLADQIELVNTAASPVVMNPELAKANPLAKVPTLMLDDGSALYDSRVICAWLDAHAKGPTMIPPGPARWAVERTVALANGILDAGILVRYELALRPADKHWPEWIANQSKKALQGLDVLNAECGSWSATIDLGQIATACALGWLEFRKPVGEMRATRAKLFGWYDQFCKRPSMQATEPKV
jgi:glutathione S-transferase